MVLAQQSGVLVEDGLGIMESRKLAQCSLRRVLLFYMPKATTKRLSF
jgi:hypothetical protein